MIDKIKQMISKKNKDNDTAAKKQLQKQSSRGLISSVKVFFVGVKIELKKVYWPTQREIMVYTGVVLITVAFIMLLVWVLDIILTYGLSLIIK